MMFGDMGHGSIVLTFGLIVVLFHEQLKKTSLSAVGDFRYLLLLMGIMSTYCGFIYNEFFALPVQIFDSCYTTDQRVQWNPFLEEGYTNFTKADVEKYITIKGEYVYLRKSPECTYPMGYDYVWGVTSNKLMFANNIKMKLSVIMGVTHMTMGIFHKGANSIFFRRFPDFWLEVVVGTIILLGLFGWMNLLIFAKWLYPLNIEDKSDATLDDFPLCQNGGDGGKPLNLTNFIVYGDDDVTPLFNIPKFKGDIINENMPSVVNSMIVTVFSAGNYKDVNPSNGCALQPLIAGSNDTQYGIALALLIIVIILCPIMLCVKPCFFRQSP